MGRFLKCDKKKIDTHETKPKEEIEDESSLPKCQIDRFQYGESKNRGNIWVHDNLLGKNIIDIYCEDTDLMLPLRNAMFKCLKDKYGD